MEENIDEIDQRILRVLQIDAALSVEAVADKVHLSRNACWRRIKQLENAGVVQRRVAILDGAALGKGQSVFVMVKAQDHSASWLKGFRQAVSAMPEIIGAFRMSGDLDYLLRVEVGSVAEYDRFYQRFIERIKAADISASFVMERIKDTTELPI